MEIMGVDRPWHICYGSGEAHPSIPSSLSIPPTASVLYDVCHLGEVFQNQAVVVTSSCLGGGGGEKVDNLSFWLRELPKIYGEYVFMLEFVAFKKDPFGKPLPQLSFRLHLEKKVL